MNDTEEVFWEDIFWSQSSLICAILAELDRQNPGALISQRAMNTIIQAADLIVEIAVQGYISVLEGPNHDH